MKTVKIGVLILLLVAIGFSLRPITNFSQTDTTALSGIVENVSEGSGQDDIEITIVNDDNIYYINRGLEKGIDIEVLRSELVGQKIDLLFKDQWSIFGVIKSRHHLAEIKADDYIVYSELK